MRIAMLSLLLALPPAAALADACQTVKAAFDKLAAAPAVAQTISMPGMAPMRMVALPDAMYIDQGAGSWTKLPMEPGMRAEMLAQAAPDASVLSDCAEAGAEALEGVATTVYAYTPPSFAGETPEPQRLWIGDADGLPYRMTTTVDGEPMEMTIRYEGVTAPE